MPSAAPTHSAQRRRTRLSRARHRGFTLVELVVVLIIIGVLAALAVPRFLNLGTQARVASVQSLAGALRSASEFTHVLCQIDTGCANSLGGAYVFGGKFAAMYFGYLDAGDAFGSGEIDAWITYDGFTGVLENPRTRFQIDGAPDPMNCWAAYNEATSWTAPATVTTATSGC